MLTAEREAKIRAWADKHHWLDGSTKYDYRSLLAEIDKLREKLTKYEFRLKHIADNTECIGLEKCHVDGNCIYCLAKTRGPYADA